MSSKQDLQDALNDVRRLKEDYNEGRNNVTSSDVWVAHGYLADTVEKFLKLQNKPT
jgi:hypothetical protein